MNRPVGKIKINRKVNYQAITIALSVRRTQITTDGQPCMADGRTY